MLDSPAFSVFCFPFSAFRPSFSRCAFKRTTSFVWGSYFLLPAAVLEISHSAECDQGLCPMDPAAFKKAGEIFFFPSFGWGSYFLFCILFKGASLSIADKLRFFALFPEKHTTALGAFFRCGLVPRNKITIGIV